MTTTLRSVSFHSGGYCRQLARLTGMRCWSIQRFHALCVHFDHPEHGPSLIDTGYSQHFREATRPFPQRFHRWLLPVCLHPDEDPPQILKSAGCDGDIRRIFISHWHSDHVAGLKCFPRSEFVYRSPAYKQLMAQGTVSQVRHGFLRDLLLPDWEFHVSSGRPGHDGATIRDNLHCYDYVPYDRFLGRYDAAVIHGGTGITYACIQAGVPMLVWPQDYDQFDHAARIVEHGLGKRMTPRASAIAASLQETVGNRALRKCLHEFQEKCRTYDARRWLSDAIRGFACKPRSGRVT